MGNGKNGLSVRWNDGKKDLHFAGNESLRLEFSVDFSLLSFVSYLLSFSPCLGWLLARCLGPLEDY